MKKYLSIAFAGIFFILSGCGSVPITGRKQMLLVSDQEVLSLSLQQYGEFINSAPKSSDSKNSALVSKVGQKIAMAVETYLRNNGYASEIQNFAWEFNLIKSSDVNAFCMPGGKIVVFEGILPYTQDETGLAVVIGHEVAHAVAKHSNERMSQQIGASIVGSAIDQQSGKWQQYASAAFGLGAQYGILLPFSRKQELEADELGLIFMAMAGYNPSHAELFWSRMAQNGSSTPEFASTHPSDERRILDIRKNLPKALKYYNGGAGTTTPPAKTSSQWSF